MRNQIGWHKT